MRIHHRHGRPASTIYVLADSLDGLFQIGLAARRGVSWAASLFGQFPSCPLGDRRRSPQTAGHELTLYFRPNGPRWLVCERCRAVFSTKTVEGENWQRLRRFVDLVPVA